jgi:RNA polymerase sigma-70 factor (ECF subfamily)
MNELPEQPTPKPASQQEFLTVFLANEREIYRYVAALVPTRGDAQEIVQQTAVALWEKFDDYDRSLPFAPWACRFSLNIARRWMARRQRWKVLLESGLADELALRREQLQPEFDARLTHLNQCMSKLPSDHRQLVESYYFQETTIETLADQTQRSVDAVYKVLQRIRRQLRDCIERTQRGEATA